MIIIRLQVITNYLMKKSLLFILVSLLALLSVRCVGDLVTEDTKFADRQLRVLLEACDAGDTVRVPASFIDSTVTFVPITDWVSGFFAGSLWYMYELTGDSFWELHARAHTERVDSIKHLTWHHDVRFMIGDSFGNGYRLTGDPAYREVMLEAARSLSTRFRPVAGILQSWNADTGWQHERGWKCPVIVDNMMNLEILFKATQESGDSTFYRMAVSHADKTLENHFREDASSFHVVDYDPETGEIRGKYTAQGCDDSSAWARGQSWGLYGFTMAYEYTRDERYLAQAERIAQFLLQHPHLPADKVPYWDYDAPGIPDTYRDVSSAAIMAAALYRLAGLTGAKTEYKNTADKILQSLSSPAYRAELGSNGGFLLKHSVGHLPAGGYVDVPLTYADYYYLEALLRKKSLTK